MKPNPATDYTASPIRASTFFYTTGSIHYSIPSSLESVLFQSPKQHCEYIYLGSLKDPLSI
jgi:hypothetical protein